MAPSFFAKRKETAGGEEDKKRIYKNEDTQKKQMAKIANFIQNINKKMSKSDKIQLTFH